jgi:signal transduction histidine kinase
VVVSVCDDGVGMTEEVRKNLFNPFFTTKDKGLGLGLFIVHNIVKAHGGYIEVESQPNTGSTFLIYLPEKRI